MHSIHPLFLISLIAFLLPHSYLTVTLSETLHFFLLAFFLLLTIYALYVLSMFAIYSGIKILLKSSISA